MKKTLIPTLLIAGLLVLSASVGAHKPKKVILPAGVTEEMLAPPPVPRFMLEKPAKPLTTDEMVQQAREAEAKAKAAVVTKPQ